MRAVTEPVEPVVLDPSGRAERVADHVRRGILDGTHRLGSRLSEPQICGDLHVSRNTLREAFRTLAEERLVVHELNRGVFVRVPTDAGRARAVRRPPARGVRGGGHPPGRCRWLGAGDRDPGARGRDGPGQDWVGVGTADIDFHRALTALGSTRVGQLMQSVWNEMRLAFHVVASPGEFHGSYLARNHVVLDTLLQRGGVAAARELRAYLDEAEQRVLRAYRERAGA